MKKLILSFALALSSIISFAQNNKPAIIAYYTGKENEIDRFDTQQLSHIIFSFCHLKDGKLSVYNQKDSLAIQHLVGLKQKHKDLKIMLSLGGWSGCEPCSAAFATEEGRQKFALSVKEVNDYFKTDGIDLDWEYPAIEGFPGHLYQKEDKPNFTDLVVKLRKVLGKDNELSFAAGGFVKFLDESIEWQKVMPLVDRVNIMSYDLVNGYSTVTGHHTPLFSTHKDEESTDKAVQYLLKLGIPSHKLVIGAAFYTRMWEGVENINNGLYQKGKHVAGVNFKGYEKHLNTENGWQWFWDNKAKARYAYNATEKKFATGDENRSVMEKSQYVLDQKLGGIMFWELLSDTDNNGLLNEIYQTIYKR